VWSGPVVPVVAETIVEDMLGPETTTIDVQRLHEQGGEFIQMPCGQVVPVVAEATLEDMLGLGPGPETTHCGEWSGGMATARIPWSSSYGPTSSSYTAACSGLRRTQRHAAVFFKDQIPSSSFLRILCVGTWQG
jgi:hypothetical protein